MEVIFRKQRNIQIFSVEVKRNDKRMTKQEQLSWLQRVVPKVLEKISLNEEEEKIAVRIGYVNFPSPIYYSFPTLPKIPPMKTIEVL